ncbi:TnsA endonuclease N-terminal domain-containing protein [Thiolapillus sp.]|uniref:TnsA endonuclease N-terminal domain-containing protein n=7 Tax=Thiolapillus sp. TaxID=2017437 RepID=UPI0025E0C8FA|nr:TnsA endonuclease N-terminal domain-containing protein [Thiolapillus sp.]
MSVRKIPRNYRVITGCVASEKSANNAAEFEGSLERDLYHMLDFDWTVEHFEEQPVEIRYKDARGKTRKYTPDVLIKYVPEVDRKPVLAEVKFRKELKEQWREFKPRFRAALRFAKENGWVFRLLTEREIRTQSLLNTKFLRRFKNRNVEEEDMHRILHQLARSGEITPADLYHQLRQHQRLRPEQLGAAICPQPLGARRAERHYRARQWRLRIPPQRDHGFHHRDRRFQGKPWNRSRWGGIRTPAFSGEGTRSYSSVSSTS